MRFSLSLVIFCVTVLFVFNVCFFSYDTRTCGIYSSLGYINFSWSNHPSITSAKSQPSKQPANHSPSSQQSKPIQLTNQPTHSTSQYSMSPSVSLSITVTHSLNVVRRRRGFIVLCVELSTSYRKSPKESSTKFTSELNCKYGISHPWIDLHLYLNNEYAFFYCIRWTNTIY